MPPIRSVCSAWKWLAIPTRFTLHTAVQVLLDTLGKIAHWLDFYCEKKHVGSKYTAQICEHA